MIVEEVEISVSSCHIVHCWHIVSRMLMQEQCNCTRFSGMLIGAADIFKRSSQVTTDISCRNSSVGGSYHCHREPWLSSRITQKGKSCWKYFFDFEDIVHHEFISDIATVKEEFVHLQEAVCLNCPKMWVAKDWVLLCDSVSVHMCLLVYQQLAKNSTVVFLHHTQHTLLISRCMFLTSFHVWRTDWMDVNLRVQQSSKWFSKLCCMVVSRNV